MLTTVAPIKCAHLPVVCPYHMEYQTHREISGAKYSQQRVEDSGAPRQAEALVTFDTLLRHQSL